MLMETTPSHPSGPSGRGGRRDITVLSGLQAVDLLKEDGQVCGVYALDEAGAPVIVHAGSVVLATGGASRLFRRNMYPRDITGDGYAMAWRPAPG